MMAESKTKRKTYDFPNALLHVYSDRTCGEQPKWCLCISVERPREDVAKALWLLRKFRAKERRAIEMRRGD